MPTSTTTSTTTSPAGAMRPGPEIDQPGGLGSVALFFVLAYALAWTVWFALGALASDAGMTTIDLVAEVEAGRFDAVTEAGSGWMLYGLTRLVDFSFSIVGVAMVAATAGRAGLRRMVARLTSLRFPLRWYALALAPVFLYLAAGLLITRSENGSVELDGSTIPTVLWSLEAGVLVSLLFRGAMGEELGLRGFALPALQRQLSPRLAALVIGIGWALWHLPVLVDDPATAPVLFTLIVALSFILTWLFNGTGGSLIGPLLFHATQNAEEAVEMILPAIVDTDWEAIPALGLLALAVVAAIRLTGWDHSGQTAQNA